MYGLWPCYGHWWIHGGRNHQIRIHHVRTALTGTRPIIPVSKIRVRGGTCQYQPVSFLSDSSQHYPSCTFCRRLSLLDLLVCHLPSSYTRSPTNHQSSEPWPPLGYPRRPRFTSSSVRDSKVRTTVSLQQQQQHPEIHHTSHSCVCDSIPSPLPCRQHRSSSAITLEPSSTTPSRLLHHRTSRVSETGRDAD